MLYRYMLRHKLKLNLESQIIPHLRNVYLSYLRGRHSQESRFKAIKGKLVIPWLNIKKGWGCRSVAEHLSSPLEALGWIPKTKKRKRNKHIHTHTHKHTHTHTQRDKEWQKQRGKNRDREANNDGEAYILNSQVIW